MPVVDKLKLWQAACYRVLEERSDIGFLLQDKAYLDCLEGSEAVVGVKTWNLLSMLEQKRVVPLLETIFSEITGRTVRVKLAHGRPRIIAAQSKKQAIHTPDNLTSQEVSDLEALHAEYGDIMSIVDQHPVFVQASKPLTKGGWGIFNKQLTIACIDYGADVVLRGLQDVANQPRVDRPRSYFFTNLRAGIYGHKLAKPAPILGPISART
jgi:hypothetical protein